jgi:translation initiation factor 4A
MTDFEDLETWDDLDNIDVNILRGIYAYGYEKPSPIQRKAIRPVIAGRDIIGQAQSGTGKTATFTIGSLSKIDLSLNETQVLIMSPTRELCTQTANVVTHIGGMMKGLRVQTAFGGLSAAKSGAKSDMNWLDRKRASDKQSEKQSEKRISDNPHIICGCPGRIYDMLNRNKLTAKYLKIVVIDEADEMLSEGFKEQVYNIFKFFHDELQIAIFSATMPESMLTLANKFMRDPVRISVKAEMLTLEGISQFYVALDDDQQKYAVLKDIFASLSVSQTIIYCNSVKRVADLYDAMLHDEFPVGCIHSSMDKDARDAAISDFRNGKTRVLISSDVTARGIDVQQVSVVVNFDVPRSVHTYLHRIGRSGRWGRKGVGINFITRRDANQLREIEKYYNCEIREMPENIDTFVKN